MAYEEKGFQVMRMGDFRWALVERDGGRVQQATFEER